MFEKILIATCGKFAGHIRPASVLALLLSPLVIAPQASACSVSRRPAATAEARIEGRTDLRRIIGRYQIVEVVQPTEYGRPATILGRVTSRSGQSYDTAHLYSEVWVDCLIYYLPQQDASGTFYLSRRRQDGRSELVDWSGTYIPGRAITSPGEESPQ